MKNLADYLMVIDDVLPKEYCDYLIDKFENTASGAYKRTSDFEWKYDYRKFSELNIYLHQDWGPENKVFLDKTLEIYPFYRKAVNAHFLPTIEDCHFEHSRMKKYENNGYDQFGWHADAGDAESAKRSLAIFYYLNDVPDGGETIFGDPEDSTHLTVKPKAGRILIFPPNWLFPHKGCKPVSNPKYVVSTYTHFA